MNRKLHNTVTALFATGGLLALSLVAGRPLLPAPLPGAASTEAMQVARIETATHRIEAQGQALDRQLQADAALPLAALTNQAAALEQALDPTDKPRPGPVRHARRGRQSVAMPFFSFFPKG